MPHIFERVSSRKYANPKLISSQNTQEQPLTGSSKISYRPGEDWDFEGCTESALIDVNLVMPPYRPKTQPEHHRTSMYLGSESGPIKARVCRHCFHRPFHLEVAGGSSDVTIWIPSNFKGFILYGTGASQITFSAAVVTNILPNACVNRPVPKGWNGDLVEIRTSGNISFRVWDIFSKAPEEPQKLHGWRKMFGGAEKRPPPTPTWNWDFLIEDN